jgi:hypothetical protein
MDIAIQIVAMKPLHDDSSEVSAPPVPDRPDTTRRRFFIASVVAAPLLVTLTARPARAQGPNSAGTYGYGV